MIKQPKPKSPERILRDKLSAIRAEIQRYEQPSELGDRHDARVRSRWTAHVEQLKQLEADTLDELRSLA